MTELNKLGHPSITGLPAQNRTTQKTTAEAAQSFQDLLRQRMTESTHVAPSGITFSKHAQVRQMERNIELSAVELEQLGTAVEKAQQKGLNDTLVYMSNKAFIVNVPNKIVITVVDGDDASNTVFTNIDGAVIV